MARQKGKIVININDIVGKCFGKLEVVSYSGMRYDNTKGGPRLRHWYNCLREGVWVVIQRGQIMREEHHDGNKDAKQ